MNSDKDISFLNGIIKQLDRSKYIPTGKVIISKAGLVCTISELLNERYSFSDNTFSDLTDFVNPRHFINGMGIRIVKNFEHHKELKVSDDLSLSMYAYGQAFRHKRILIDSRPFFNVFKNTKLSDIKRNVRLLKCANFDKVTIAQILEIEKTEVRMILKEIYGKRSS